MKFKSKSLLLAMATLALGTSLVGCNDNSGTVDPIADDIVNGDFEDVSAGKWVGWTRKDAAFNFRGIVSDEKIHNVPMEKSGTYYFAGSKGGNGVMRGTLTSDPFKLGGNGFITFKMGGGLNKEKIYVEFMVDGAAVAKVANEDCDGAFITEHLITKVVDLSAYKGKTVTIVVTDNDDGDDLSWVNLDAFKVCKDQAEVDAAKAEHDLQIETYGEKPFVEDPTSNYIVNGGFETGDLTGWKVLEGKALTTANIVPTSQFYWNDRMVYGEGNFYIDGVNNGAVAENLTGAIRSTKFTLGGDGFITFMLGAGNGGSYIALCDAETDEELMKQENTSWNDPALALTLLRYYMDASAHIGKVCYMKLVDAADGSAAGGFAFINCDDVRVSMTRDEVATLEVEQLSSAKAQTYCSATYPNDLRNLVSYYENYNYPVELAALKMKSFAPNVVVDCAASVDLNALVASAKASFGALEINAAITKVVHGGNEITTGFDAFDLSEAGYYNVHYAATKDTETVDAYFTVVAVADHNNLPNGGFEAGNLAGWTVLTDGWSVVNGQAAGVITASTYWGEELPYNQAGNYHLDGWNTGIGEGDAWAIRSSKFVLAGSGFISVRMGGNAARVRVYKADGTQIGYYQQNRFNDANFPHLSQGGHWADMGTYVMDLHEFIDQELYIELVDEQIAAGWAHGFFDEVVTYYATAPDYENLFDTVMDGHAGDETPSEVQIPWQLAANLLS